MTSEETKRLFNYAMMNYPSFRRSDAELDNLIKLWTSEFINVPFKKMIEAFRYARTESPEWMPTLPMVQRALVEIDAQNKSKNPEQEFKDSHGGKTREEWEQYQAWIKSEGYKQRNEEYRKRIKAIFGGQNEKSTNL